MDVCLSSPQEWQDRLRVPLAISARVRKTAFARHGTVCVGVEEGAVRAGPGKRVEYFDRATGCIAASFHRTLQLVRGPRPALSKWSVSPPESARPGKKCVRKSS